MVRKRLFETGRRHLLGRMGRLHGVPPWTEPVAGSPRTVGAEVTARLVQVCRVESGDIRQAPVRACRGDDAGAPGIGNHNPGRNGMHIDPRCSRAI